MRGDPRKPRAPGSMSSAADCVEFWDMTNKQDWYVCELSQAGIASPAYVPGPYSNREDLLYAFDRFIVSFHEGVERQRRTERS